MGGLGSRRASAGGHAERKAAGRESRRRPVRALRGRPVGRRTHPDGGTRMGPALVTAATSDHLPIYDRALLLNGARRDAVLDLSEVQRYGHDSFGDPDYVAIYGMRPAEWYAKGVRMLGRTAVECTPDVLADAIGRDVAAIAARATAARPLVLDPFAGSGNTLYWLLRHLP